MTKKQTQEELFNERTATYHVLFEETSSVYSLDIFFCFVLKTLARFSKNPGWYKKVTAILTIGCLTTSNNKKIG